MSYAITIWEKSSIGNRNLCVNALNRVRKDIYNNIDNNIITNNNLLDYDSIFECFTSVKRNKVLNHNSHDYFSDKLTQLTANHSYGGSSHVFGQNFRFFLLLKNKPQERGNRVPKF